MNVEIHKTGKQTNAIIIRKRVRIGNGASVEYIEWRKSIFDTIFDKRSRKKSEMREHNEVLLCNISAS